MLRSSALLFLALVVGAPTAAFADDRCGDLPCETVEASASDKPWRAPNRVRAALELATFVALGGAWYWIDRERQVADWDFPTIRERFTREVYVNDHNPFDINYIWHTVGGTYFHLAGRSNDLGLWESAGFGLGASLAWEYGIEYREKVSVNDIVFTTWAGMAGGEFLHWTGRLLQQEFPGIAGDIARWTAGAPQTLHDQVDGRRGQRGPYIHHEFRLSTGYSRGRAESDGESESGIDIYNLRFDGRLAALGDYLRPGKRGKWFLDGNFTEMQARYSKADSGSGRFFQLDSMLLGWRQEDIADDGTGVGVAVGTSVGVRYFSERWNGWYDRLGTVQFPGLAVDAVVAQPAWTLRASMRGNADYAGVHETSYGDWREANPTEVGKTVLEREEYYYAWGLSTRVRAELDVLDRVAAGTSLFFGRYRSQQDFDRFQDMLTVDQDGRKGYFDYDAWLRARVYEDAYVELRRSGQRRSSTFEDFEASTTHVRHTVELGTRF